MLAQQYLPHVDMQGEKLIKQSTLQYNMLALTSQCSFAYLLQACPSIQ
jgi:hypothetical protein